MPRHGRVPHREIEADTKYQSKLVSKLINSVMKHGERATAERERAACDGSHRRRARSRSRLTPAGAGETAQRTAFAKTRSISAWW